MMPDKYDRVEEVGEDPFGVVFKCYRRVDKKEVFIKLYYNGNDSIKAQKQIPRWRKLEHDNILSLVEVIKYRGEQLVYEYLPLNLKQFMESYPEMLKNLQVIKDFLHQILSGVAYLHAHDIVHEELNPHNLLIDPSKNLVKVADLWLTGKLDYNSRKLATLSYKGPEFYIGPGDSAPSDVWAVGCIFAEMISQKILFPGECEGGVYMEILRFFDVPKIDTPLESSELFSLYIFQSVLKVKSLADVVTDLDPLGFDLLSKMLIMNPAARITAKEALTHAYFMDASHK